MRCLSVFGVSGSSETGCSGASVTHKAKSKGKKCSVIVYKYNLEQILENILICLGQNKMTHEF